ncbi:uncharacterized protein MELLADRAFT_94759 [Melampsora larici-populina 98AG31]|uniref:C2H2-type domain-containing protein n=1 Tax=Melampsora larici-populina (strain 98AG31 / pathotype 3-4-7) TaxID=747676 RepID=F4S7U0_MELLP|nr:uncharacterized protein MELLADRAFT_94759 [Melampsora larici-populina 98AG31]EGF99303.1 hypothetical protein MELLADRAFT_94759 [Melampsora larici-populina 98AG31]
MQYNPLKVISSYSMADGYNTGSGRRDVYRGYPSDQSSPRPFSGHQSSDPYLHSNQQPSHSSFSPYAPVSGFAPDTFDYQSHSTGSPPYLDSRTQMNLHSSPSYGSQPHYPTTMASQNRLAYEYSHPSNPVYHAPVMPHLQSSSTSDYRSLPHDPRVSPNTGVVRNHICPTCGKGFGRPSSLAQHEFTHTGERPYVCNVCNKAFNTSSNLKRHQGLHETA